MHVIWTARMPQNVCCHSHVHRDQKQNVPPLTCPQRSKTKCSPTHTYTEIKNKMFPHSLVHRDKKQNVPPTHMYTEIKNKMFPHSHVHRDQKQNVPPLTCTQRSKTKCSPTHMYTEIKNKMFPIFESGLTKSLAL